MIIVPLTLFVLFFLLCIALVALQKRIYVGKRHGPDTPHVRLTVPKPVTSNRTSSQGQ